MLSLLSYISCMGHTFPLVWREGEMSHNKVLVLKTITFLKSCSILSILFIDKKVLINWSINKLD